MPYIEDENIGDDKMQRERQLLFKKQISASAQFARKDQEPIGTILISIIRGRLIRDTELLGEMDPFVQIQYGSEILTTNVIANGGKNPEWNQQYEIPILSLDDLIRFACLDKDVIADDMVGHTLIPISYLQ